MKTRDQCILLFFAHPLAMVTNLSWTSSQRRTFFVCWRGCILFFSSLQSVFFIFSSSGSSSSSLSIRYFWPHESVSDYCPHFIICHVHLHDLYILWEYRWQLESSYLANLFMIPLPKIALYAYGMSTTSNVTISVLISAPVPRLTLISIVPRASTFLLPKPYNGFEIFLC
jgi:hypothetical protein